MTSVVSALIVPPGVAAAAPQVGRAAPPARAPCAQGPWRILQHHSGAPSRNQRPRQSPRLPLRSPAPGRCHGILTLALFSPPSALGTGREWAQWARRQCHRGASLFLGPAGAGHSSIHSIPAGLAVGVTRARRESTPVRGVSGLELSLTRICLSSAPRCVPDRSARLARSPSPRASRERRGLAGPCSGGRRGAPSGGSAPCEKARDAPATVNGAARQDTPAPTRSALRA